MEFINGISTYAIPGIAVPGIPAVDDERILRTVAGYFRISVEAIRMNRRYQGVLIPRQIAMYFYIIRGYPLSKTGRICGGKDHSTAYHARRAVERMMLTNYKDVRDHVKALEAML